MNPAIAAALACGLALVGSGLGWLTLAGAGAAAVVGAAVLTGGGPAGAVLLASFFVSGSLLTKLSHVGGRRDRLDLQSGGRRARQVLANGSWAAIGALLIPVWQGGWPLMVGALAAAQADTWATELGAFSRKPPRLISSGRVVPPGTSGGITLTGTAGGAVGAATLAGLGAMLGPAGTALTAGLTGGVLGMMLDSLLGATLQAGYYCDSCGTAAETPAHQCGRTLTLSHGWRWLDNDAVNLVATGSGAGVALVLWGLV
ncbi:MAG: DUF92 domain-containing protein [Gemmatimonadota bacterium]|nr:MAG: DUF92 domain-containing protein [Gemmatimonadota bacterium]